ncbi:MAG: hypothetical protein ABIQ72_12610 [Usitatibacter sp.]
MKLPHAVVWTDHHDAQVVQFNEDEMTARKLHAPVYDTAQHGSEVRSEHEFFGEVCTALEGIPVILVTGSHTAVGDFRHYVEKHRPQISTRIAAYDIVDKLTENQLLAHGRKHFA